MKKIISFLLLLIIAGSSSLQAQTDESYKPLLELGKEWIHGIGASDPHTNYYEAIITDTIVYQDTLFYQIDDLGGIYFLREDTINKKVYMRIDINSNERILYDFSLEVGDVFDDKLYVDSIKNEEYFDVDRKVFYMHKLDIDDKNVMWIEGIGSWSGLSSYSYNIEADYYQITNWGFGMTCCSLNDNLIYQNSFATLYGCRGEMVPPEMINMIVYHKVLHIDSSQAVTVIFDGYTDVDLELTFTGPSGNTYNLTEFRRLYSPDGPMGYITVYNGDFNDFNGEIGDWYLSHLKAETSAGGVLEKNYSPDDYGFYVTDNNLNIKETSDNEINIYPNPVSDVINIEFDNSKNEEYTIKISDLSGKILYEQNTISSTQIDMSPYQSGFYFISIINDNQILYTDKFIKQ